MVALHLDVILLTEVISKLETVEEEGLVSRGADGEPDPAICGAW